jgi:hypothetical protein
MRVRSEVALSRFQLAELQLEHFPDEKEEAIEHLDFALSEFKIMKIKPSIDKAEELKEKTCQIIKLKARTVELSVLLTLGIRTKSLYCGVTVDQVHGSNPRVKKLLLMRLA